ncbi:MAG: dTDP-4-dehydrorhamnose reductase [Pleomorphochaeta sp.]
MKVLVTGVKGQLGFDVIKRLKISNIECFGVDIEDFDITNYEQTINYISNYNPTVVVHCAAYTAVDRAEEDKEKCFNINVNGTKNIAKACKINNCKMVYISTDYIFDGQGETPFEVNDIPNPINYYGETKYLGEKEVISILDEYYIIRISWVFGINGNNFIKTMLRLAETKDEILVVSDQIGSPTYTYDLSRLIVDIIQEDKYGIYHATNEGFCSWYEFACEIFKQANINIKVNPIKTEDYKTLAKRPMNSRLSKKSIQGYELLPKWENALQRFFEEL